MANVNYNPKTDDTARTDANTDQFKKTAYGAIDSAKEAAKDSLDDMEDRAKARVGLIADAYNKVSDKVVHLAGKVKSLGSDVAASSVAGKEKLESEIRENPVRSSLIAFGVGLIASRLFISGKKEVRYHKKSRYE